MITVLSIICATIVICFAIRYGCRVYCQNVEYSIYRDQHKDELNPFGVRPYFYKGERGENSFWGFVVYDNKEDCIYKGSEKSNENFIIYRSEESAMRFCNTVRKLHGY